MWIWVCQENISSLGLLLRLEMKSAALWYILSTLFSFGLSINIPFCLHFLIIKFISIFMLLIFLLLLYCVLRSEAVKNFKGHTLDSWSNRKHQCHAVLRVILLRNTQSSGTLLYELLQKNYLYPQSLPQSRVGLLKDPLALQVLLLVSIYLLNNLILNGRDHTLYLFLHLEGDMTNLSLVKLFIYDVLHLSEENVFDLDHVLHVS